MLQTSVAEVYKGWCRIERLPHPSMSREIVADANLLNFLVEVHGRLPDPADRVAIPGRVWDTSAQRWRPTVALGPVDRNGRLPVLTPGHPATISPVDSAHFVADPERGRVSAGVYAAARALIPALDAALEDIRENIEPDARTRRNLHQLIRTANRESQRFAAAWDQGVEAPALGELQAAPLPPEAWVLGGEPARPDIAEQLFTAIVAGARASRCWAAAGIHPDGDWDRVLDRMALRERQGVRLGELRRVVIAARGRPDIALRGLDALRPRHSRAPDTRAEPDQGLASAA